MVRKTASLVFGMIVAVAALALPAGGQNKKEIDPALVSRVTLTANAQNLGSPCQGDAQHVCIKVNWTVDNQAPINKIADFHITVDATNGNPASKNKESGLAPTNARTATLRVAQVGSTFKVRVIARNSAQQTLATVDTTGNF